MTAAIRSAAAPADHGEGGRGCPLELRAGQADPDEEERDAAGDQDGAEVVDLHGALDDLGQVQGHLQQDDRDDGDGQREEEVPAPAERVGHDTAEQRAADHADGHDAAEETGVLAALTRGDDVGHDDLAERSEATGTEALHDAEDDQRRGVLREPGEGRAENEDDERDLDEQLAAEQVGELAPDGRRDGGREQRRGDDPGERRTGRP